MWKECRQEMNANSLLYDNIFNVRKNILYEHNIHICGQLSVDISSFYTTMKSFSYTNHILDELHDTVTS